MEGGAKTPMVEEEGLAREVERWSLELERVSLRMGTRTWYFRACEPY